MPAQLTLRDVTKSYDGRLVLDGISLTVKPGEHVAVVGENGSGKSTLLRLIAGQEPPDEGTVTVTVDALGGIGHLGQTLGLPATHTVRQVIDTALAELRAMEARLRKLEADLTEERMAEYGDLLALYEARGGYEAPARTDMALQALGLGSVDRARPLGSLSGGEQARLGLACLLAAAPQLMLLDEPSNHLDDAALNWLEERLRTHRGTVLTVSHDRMFLEGFASTIVEVEGGAVTRYGGGYRGFLAQQAAVRQRWQQAYEDWRREVREAERSAATTARRVAHGRAMRDGNKMAYDRDAGRVQSSIASRVRQAQERLRRLHLDPVAKPPQRLRFAGDFSAGSGTSGVLASLRDVQVGERLRVNELHIEHGQRLLVYGPNGAGKSTLLRLLAGDISPDRGTVRRRGRTGHLPQEPHAGDPARSLLAAFAEGRPGYRDEHRQLLLSLGLFHADALDVPVGRLSVGQRQRLALAGLLTRPSDLLLLDEPTNHLSPALVEELEQALLAYKGTLIVVSHDRTLRNRFGGTQLRMHEGELA